MNAVPEQQPSSPVGPPGTPVRRRARRWIIGLVLLVVICGGLYRQREPILAAAGRWLNVSEPLRHPVDYVFILGGDSDTRPFAAAALVKEGLAKKVLIAQSVPEPDSDGTTLPHHNLLRQVLLERGVPADAIIELPVKVLSTADEAAALKNFLLDHPGETAVVVTNDYHTRRTRMLFSRRLGELESQVQVFGTPTDRFNASNWWHYEQGVKIYINEYVKMIYDLI